MSISILSQMLVDLESCLCDFETNEVFIIRDLPRNTYYDRYFNQCKLLLNKIQKLRDKVVNLEINNFNLPKLLEEEVNEKRIEMDKTIMVSKAFGTMSNENSVLYDINRISEMIDWIIDFINKLQVNVKYSQMENIQKNDSLLAIGKVKFYFIDKEISKIVCGKTLYEKKEISKNLDLKEIGWNGSTQIALSWLYAIAKKYNENKDREFVFDFLSKKSEKDFQYFRDNCKIIHTRKTKDGVKITPKKRPYYNIVKDINKLSDVRGIVLEKTDLEDSDKEIRYLVKVIGKKYA